jgi:hypothetical protein
MPKRGNRRGNKSMASADEVLVPFRVVHVGVTTAGVSVAFRLAPVDLGARCLEEADLWQNFCIEKLHVELKPSNLAPFDQPMAAGVYLNQTDNPTAITFADVTQQSHFAMVVPGQTVSQRTSVGTKELMATKAQKSFKTIQGGADDWDEFQGNVVLASNGAEGAQPYVLVLSGVIRFSSMATGAATPSAKVFSRREKEILNELVETRVRSILAGSSLSALLALGTLEVPSKDCQPGV